MRKCVQLVFFISLSNAFHFCLAQGYVAEKFQISGKAQGTTYDITYFANQPFIQKSQVDSVLDVIDKSMSLYREDTKISEFNRPDVESVEMDAHMRSVMEIAFDVHQRSLGLFDVTVKPLVDLWGFGSQSNSSYKVDSAEVESILPSIGMAKNLDMRGHRLIKRHPKVSIDLNGIAQGYTVDVLSDFLASRGVKNYLVELGGEIKANGHKPDGSAFSIGIQGPTGMSDESSRTILIEDAAVTTSGTYERERVYQGEKISHHIDPRTGYPLSNGNISVTVIADKVVTADAWDNVFMMLPPNDAIKLANSLKKIEIYMIYKQDGKISERYSNGFKKFLKN